MNLRDQLKEILPDILPRNPGQAIKGTELIELVKYRLKQEYSDATLRYHFSIMSCDPSSPIAKVEQGQGYYLRTTTIHSLNSARNMLSSYQGQLGDDMTLNSEDHDLTITRANKFRAVVQRYLESIQKTPFAFEESFSTKSAQADRWRYPDLSSVEWLTGEMQDDSFVLNRQATEVYRKMGKSPFQVSSVKLRLELNHLDLFEDLYQCLSTSEWANTGEIMIAAPVNDEQLVEQIRQFASRYGIGVTSFGLDADVLDDMPEPAAVENLMAREFEAIQSLFDIRRYASPRISSEFDWEHVRRAAGENSDFARFESWLSSCVINEQVISARDFNEQLRQSNDSSAAA